MATILVAAEIRDLLDPGILEGHAVEWMEPDRPTPSGDFDAVIPIIVRRIGPAELDGLPKLKIVANYGVGYDNLDVAAMRDRGVVVTNTPGVLTNATADLTWTLILGAARRVQEGQRLIDEGWPGWHPTQLLGLELDGATLGVVGAGRIGQAVARRGRGFGMSILYTDQVSRDELERDTGARRVSLDELVARSDIVSLHVPLTDETRSLFDARRLGSMKPGSILVNTSRGGVVDEGALVEALDRGHLFAAGLDVFEGEPAIRPALVDHPSVLCLPHLGSATRHTRSAMANLAARNVRAVLRGEPPITPVPG